MRNPYELAKDILLTTELSDRFTSIDLYGASVRENGAGADSSGLYPGEDSGASVGNDRAGHERRFDGACPFYRVADRDHQAGTYFCDRAFQRTSYH